MRKKSEEFIHWAEKYDDPNFKGRSLTVHNNWLAKLNCPVLRIDGAMKLNQKSDIVQNQIKWLRNNKME